MKIRLIALILCGLLLAAPTMRAPAECAEIAPEPPAVNTEGLRRQAAAADLFAEAEEITAEEPAVSPSPAAAAAPSPAGGGTEPEETEPAALEV